MKEYSQAKKICEKILTSSNGFLSSVFEHDAFAVDYWVAMYEFESRLNDMSSPYTQSLKKKLIGLEGIIKNRFDQVEVDTLMVYVKSRQLLEAHTESLNALNQVS